MASDRGLLGLVFAGGLALGLAAPAAAEEGIASWYGGRHHGRPTASGKPFDQHAMTAAHRTLPLGSRVRVTVLPAGPSLALTITDRGPFIRGRIIDVSRGAAARLGFADRGLARVRVERID